MSVSSSLPDLELSFVKDQAGSVDSGGEAEKEAEGDAGESFPVSDQKGTLEEEEFAPQREGHY